MPTPQPGADDDPADDPNPEPVAEAIRRLDGVLHEWWVRHGEPWRYRHDDRGGYR